jgi:membrane-bound metal-dependent hydrolase YbcI (DUF457 family)
MDPLTHALSGAVAGRAFVHEPDTLPGRVARAALFLGTVFPDSDVVLNLFEPNGLGTVRFHRGVTHSFVCLPLFAAALAAVAEWICRRRRMECPSWLRLSVLFGAGIGLHIGFDAITSFGTMMWSPLNWTRVSWDTTFIIDPVLTAILLLPLLLGWVYRQREKAAWRGVPLWIGLSMVALGVVWILTMLERMAAAAADAAVFDSTLELFSSLWIAGGVSVVFACVLGIPAVRGRGFRVTRRAWCMAGAATAVAYLALSAGAHAVALRRVEDFARSRGLQVQKIGALPMPPSLLFWSGLISTPDRVYHAYFSLLDARAPQFREYEQSPHDARIQEALALADVQIVLRFFRFPLIIRHEKEAGFTDVEFFDLRFLPARGDVLSFSYRVRIDTQTGRIQEEGWLVPRR